MGNILRSMVVLGVIFFSTLVIGESQINALKLYNGLTGIPLQLSDPRYSQMTSLINQGDLLGAAKIASSDAKFYNVTLRQFASHLSNRNESQQVPLNDFTAMIIGSARDYGYGNGTAVNSAGDIRELLSGSFTYTVTGVTPAATALTNAHYTTADRNGADLFQSLARVNGPNPNLPAGIPDEDIAGVITSRGYAAAHMVAGTNRRVIEYMFREFMCEPFINFGDTKAPGDMIRRDVDRTPAGNPDTFTNQCSRCHRVLDGLGNALAYFDFSQADEALTETTGAVLYKTGTRIGVATSAFDANSVANKMNVNPTQFPGGAIPSSNNWVNYGVQNNNTRIGWRPAPTGAAASYSINPDTGVISGKGLKALGLMIANSKMFSACMAKRVFTQVCMKKDYNADKLADADYDKLKAYDYIIQGIATDFEKNGYSLRYLFDRTAVEPGCL